MMKKFLLTLLIFSFVFLGIIAASLLLIPNKNIEGNMLFSNIDKHNRLDSLPSPKVIFVGGSNIAMGLNSEVIETETGFPVVNMGIHAGFGMKFVINEVRHSINEGDIVIISPTYEWFQSSSMLYGEDVLVALLFDVNRRNLRFINFRHAINLVPNTISYAISKLFSRSPDVFGDGGEIELVYTRQAFNKQGDLVVHWTMEDEYIASPTNIVQINSVVSRRNVSVLADFRNFVENRGASFYIIPPTLRHSNSLVYRDLIKNIQYQLTQRNIHFAISPQKTNMADSLFFNTPYHANKKGVDFYTEMIIRNIFNNRTK